MCGFQYGQNTGINMFMMRLVKCICTHTYISSVQYKAKPAHSESSLLSHPSSLLLPTLLLLFLCLCLCVSGGCYSSIRLTKTRRGSYPFFCRHPRSEVSHFSFFCSSCLSSLFLPSTECAFACPIKPTR